MSLVRKRKKAKVQEIVVLFMFSSDNFLLLFVETLVSWEHLIWGYINIIHAHGLHIDEDISRYIQCSLLRIVGQNKSVIAFVVNKRAE